MTIKKITSAIDKIYHDLKAVNEKIMKERRLEQLETWAAIEEFTDVDASELEDNTDVVPGHTDLYDINETVTKEGSYWIELTAGPSPEKIITDREQLFNKVMNLSKEEKRRLADEFGKGWPKLIQALL